MFASSAVIVRADLPLSRRRVSRDRGVPLDRLDVSTAAMAGRKYRFIIPVRYRLSRCCSLHDDGGGRGRFFAVNYIVFFCPSEIFFPSLSVQSNTPTAIDSRFTSTALRLKTTPRTHERTTRKNGRFRFQASCSRKKILNILFL